MEQLRPRDHALEFVPPPEESADVGTREWFVTHFEDLRNGYQDMPEDRMTPADYPQDDANEVASLRYRAQRRNKRTVAWFQAVTSYAEMAAAQFVSEGPERQRILDLAQSLRSSIDAREPTTDAQVAMGDTILDLCLEALRRPEAA